MLKGLFAKTRIGSSRLILALILLAGAYLHFRNLSGISYLDEDEARAFNLLSSGPLLYLSCSWAYNLFGHVQSAAYYIAALYGFACILVFYRILNFFFEEDISLLAAGIFAVLPLRINFARTLYPAVFLDFYFLLALYLAYLSVRRNGVFAFLSGVSASAIFFAHYCGYALIFGIAVFFAANYLRSPSSGRRKALLAIFHFASGFIAGYLFLEAVLFNVGHGYLYSRQIFGFGQNEVKFSSSRNGALLFLGEIASGVTRSSSQMLIFAVIASSLIFTLAYAFKKKEAGGLRNFLFPALAAVSIFIIAASFRLHAIRNRHFIWLGYCFALAVSFTAVYFLRHGSRGSRWVAAAVTVLFVGTCVFESYQITVETFKIGEIRSWLKDNHIPLDKVATSWWYINVLGDKDIASEIPGIFVSRPGVDPDFWFMDPGTRFMIAWPLLFRVYTNGRIKYILTSGISSKIAIGENEEALRYVKPVKVWLHPYSRFWRRPLGGPGANYIRLYDLDDVFSPANLAYLAGAEKNEK